VGSKVWPMAINNNPLVAKYIQNPKTVALKTYIP
jgi:hypothetical protein